MIEIVVAGGKGGTGKTLFSCNLITYLAKHLGESVVGVDADAEAPDLLYALGGSKKLILTRDIRESPKAVIDSSKCIKCLKCVDVCTFDAIEVVEGAPRVNPVYCEGCGACEIVCPASAIERHVSDTGVVRVDEVSCGAKVVTAELVVGGRNTGHLVYEARELAKDIARECGAKYVVIDAAAGIGCPVISSLAGANYLVAVAEPTPQALQGLRRLLEVASHFRLRPFVVLNKFGMPGSPDVRRDVEELCRDFNAEFLGFVRYDMSVVEAYTNLTPVIEYSPEAPASRDMINIFRRLVEVVSSD